MKSFPNGIGETTGDSLATALALHTTGNIWYVLSTAGTDAVSPAGLNRLSPLATLAQAISNSADFDIIVLLSGHTETLAAAVTVNKKVTIVGTGTGIGSMPRLTRSSTTAKSLDITTGPVQLRNIYFPASTGANSTAARVTFNSSDLTVKGCYFACGANDQKAALELGSSAAFVTSSGNTFISTSTTTRPHSGMLATGATTYVHSTGDVFSGGTVGWSNQYALDLTAGAQAYLFVENVSLLLDSDVGIHASSSAVVQVGTSSGSARVVHA